MLDLSVCIKPDGNAFVALGVIPPDDEPDEPQFFFLGSEQLARLKQLLVETEGVVEQCRRSGQLTRLKG